jgi:Mg2+ and Co2+ transporter CorA
VRRRAGEDGPLASRGADFLVHGLLDGLVDQFQPVVEEMDQVVDGLEVAVPKELFEGVLERIGRLCPSPG